MGVGLEDCLFVNRVSIALDSCNETGADHRCGRAGQQRLADALPIADPAGSDHGFLLGLFQDFRQRLVQPSGRLHMSTGFRALADEIIGTEIQRRPRTLSLLVTCIPSLAPAARIAEIASLGGRPHENCTIGAPASSAAWSDAAPLSNGNSRM